MNSRNTSFDGIRAIAILGIVGCHMCYGLEGMSWLGMYLGGTFNCVFFSLSALLFGKKMLMGGVKPIPFMKRRILKLVAALWPMLLAVITLFWITDVPFSMKSAVMNFCLLGWFDKLPGFGHLWFVTMIVLCYLLFVGLGYVKRSVNGWWSLPAFAVTTLCACITCQHGLPGYLFLILFYCGMLFFYGQLMLKWALLMSKGLLTVLALMTNGVVLLLFYKGVLHNGNLEMHYVTALCGIFLLLWLYRMFVNYTLGIALLYLSGISYEIYLVHHPFCFGKFSLFQWTGNYWWLGIILIAIISFVLASALNRFSKFIYPY